MAIEIELRAHLTKSQLADILSELSQDRCKNRVVEARCFIDYTTLTEGIGERKKDVRIRVTNGRPEIVVKSGQFGGTSRREAIVPFEPTKLEAALELMSMLGYSKGVLGARKITRGTLGDIEIAVQEVVSVSAPSTIVEQLVEVEYVGQGDKIDPAVRELEQFLADRGLVAYSPEEWNSFVASLVNLGHGIFEFGKTSPSAVQQLGSL